MIVLLSQVIIMLVRVGGVPVLTTLSADSVVPGSGIFGSLLGVTEQVVDCGSGTFSSVVVESHLMDRDGVKARGGEVKGSKKTGPKPVISVFDPV